MIKAIVLVPKREDMSSEEFRRYVDEIHLPLVKRLPGLRRLLIHYVHPSPDGTAPVVRGRGGGLVREHRGDAGGVRWAGGAGRHGGHGQVR